MDVNRGAFRCGYFELNCNFFFYIENGPDYLKSREFFVVYGMLVSMCVNVQDVFILHVVTSNSNRMSCMLR